VDAVALGLDQRLARVIDPFQSAPYADAKRREARAGNR
jgi:hypothetical protein